MTHEKNLARRRKLDMARRHITKLYSRGHFKMAYNSEASLNKAKKYYKKWDQGYYDMKGC